VALKAVLASKAEYDALPEVVRNEYVEKDGKYQLSIEGETDLDLKTKLAEFRDNNKKMFQELETLRPLAKKYEGVDPDEYREMKTELDGLKRKGVTKPDDVQAAIDKAVSTALKPVTEALEKERTARETAQKQANDGLFRELVTKDAIAKGVAPSAVRHVLREADLVFELKDGKLVAKDGVRNTKDPMKDLTPVDWLDQLATTDEYLFEGSKGSGAPGNNGGSNGGGAAKPNAKRLLNPSPEELGQHMDKIISGDMVVVRQ
jgi:hypothetical protein